jgi:RHS repeat-associated protein
VLYERELNEASEVLRSKTYIWGLDLNNSFQGAGGIAGLLSSKESAAAESSSYVYDENGNVCELIDSGGILQAHYTYDALGQEILATGERAQNNAYRFSTKHQDDETRLTYFGIRYFQSENGRWINRDPMEEDGGVNLFAFIDNRGINDVDYLGFSLLDKIREPQTGIFTLGTFEFTVPVDTSGAAIFFNLIFKTPDQNGRQQVEIAGGAS